VEITWARALAWRMRRHHLDPVDGGDAVAIVRRLCGVQAQVASSAALAVAVRQKKPDVGATAAALDSRDLVKTWAMRGTLHLLPTDEAGDYLPLLAAARTWTKGAWQKAFLTAKEMDRLTDAVRTALEPGEALTRDELVERIAEHSPGQALAEHVKSGWSAALKPLAWQGLLCQGPARGGSVTFMRPDAWSPAWAGLPDEDEAAGRVIRRYLAVHGPATMTGFDQWLLRGATSKTKLKRWFADLGDDVATVDVEGTTAYLLAEDEEGLRKSKPSTAVRLLPGFDQYVLAPGTADTAVLAAEHRGEVSRAAGWIAPVVVAGGRVVGTWSADDGTPAPDLWPDEGTVPTAKLKAEVARVGKLTTNRAPA
jgi:hypothetical protein